MRHYYCNGCETFTREQLLDTTLHSDPHGTGDVFHVELELACPDCHGEDIIEMEPCECCATNVPMDGLDDCAYCILGDKYSHNTRYDAGDHYEAQQWLDKNAPADLAVIEEVADKQRERALDARAAPACQ